MAERFKFAAHVKMIVDLAVKDDDRVAVVRVNRLIAGRKIDDFEAGRTERTTSRAKNPLLVGATMNNCVGGFANALRIRAPALRRKSGYSTHVLFALPPLRLFFQNMRLDEQTAKEVFWLSYKIDARAVRLECAPTTGSLPLSTATRTSLHPSSRIGKHRAKGIGEPFPERYNRAMAEKQHDIGIGR